MRCNADLHTHGQARSPSAQTSFTDTPGLYMHATYNGSLHRTSWPSLKAAQSTGRRLQRVSFACMQRCASPGSRRHLGAQAALELVEEVQHDGAVHVQRHHLARRHHAVHLPHHPTLVITLRCTQTTCVDARLSALPGVPILQALPGQKVACTHAQMQSGGARGSSPCGVTGAGPRDWLPCSRGAPAAG